MRSTFVRHAIKSSRGNAGLQVGKMSQVTTQRVDFLEKWTCSQHTKAIHQIAMLQLDKNNKHEVDTHVYTSWLF